MNLIWSGVRVLRKLGLLRYLTFSVSTTMSGRRTRVPLVKGQGLLNLMRFEPCMDRVIASLAPLFPGVFLDVGVNVAQTLIKAKNLFPALDYVGFEPNPVCVSYAERVVRLNRFTRVRFITAGLSHEDGEGVLTLWQGSADDPTATLIQGFRPTSPEQREIGVPLVSWRTAEHRLHIGRLGFVKIDVEGGELFVLRGLRDRLRSDRPVVALEVLPTHEPPIPERLERQVEIERSVREMDLAIFRLHKTGATVQAERIEAFGVHDNLEWIDHLLVPVERAQEVMDALALK